MARLQILELPEGTGDDRPPFILVVDQCVPQRYAIGAGMEPVDPWDEVAKKIGARGVIVMPDTVELPANAAPVEVSDPEHPPPTQIIDAHERTRLGLCDALLLPQDTTWRNLVNHARDVREGRDVRAANLERVRNLPRHPEIMDAQREHPHGYLQGYSAAIGEAQRAARTPRTEDGY